MLYLLDTSALLSHYRSQFGWETVQLLFEDKSISLVAATISLTEFGRRLRELGMDEKEALEELSNYELLLDNVIAIDTEIAKAAFILACRTPQRLPLVDALIAATAQVNNATLVHRDEHLRSIPVTMLHQLDLQSATS